MPNTTPSRAAEKPGDNAALEKGALDQAFDALQSYDLGSGRAALLPIDDAVVASLDNPTVRRELERRLAAVLKSDAPAAAREYVCRKLVLVGSEHSLPALRELLADDALATAARSALEVMPCDAAAKALRETLPRLSGPPKVGVINSLGLRRDTKSVSALAALLKKSTPEIAAAAAALGNIGSVPAAKELQKFLRQAGDSIRPQIADAALTCAEHLLAAGKRRDALSLYKTLNGCQLPRHFQLAVVRGLSAATDKAARG